MVKMHINLSHPGITTHYQILIYLHILYNVRGYWTPSLSSYWVCKLHLNTDCQLLKFLLPSWRIKQVTLCHSYQFWSYHRIINNHISLLRLQSLSSVTLLSSNSVTPLYFSYNADLISSSYLKNLGFSHYHHKK